jgi:hypothetical protein
MTVVTRDLVTPDAFGVPETESQRRTKTPARAAADLGGEFPRKRQESVRAFQGLSLTVVQGKVHG